MFRALSQTLSNNSSSSIEQHSISPPPSSPTRRFTLHSLVARLSDSKKSFFEQLPHHQQQLARFRKRTRSFLSSNLRENFADFHFPSNERRNSSTEIISIDEIYRRVNTPHSDDTDDYDSHGIPAPQLLQPSTLINEEQSKQILLELPARIHGMNWFMIFSTDAHGFSLSQLYRRAFEIDHDLASLLIVKDTEQNIFGAFIPHQLIISESLYGTGESFLYTFHPEFRVFNWSGYNEFYVKGDINSLGFGISGGTYGLWLDRDLYHGRTCRSQTFNSEQLTSHEDFIVASVELWTFIN